MRDEDDTPTWKAGATWKEGSPDDSSAIHGRAIHAYIEDLARRDALTREGQTYKWLRDHWPWYLRWAMGYPRAIAVLDRLGLVTLPVFVDQRDAPGVISMERALEVVGVPQPLKPSTNAWTIQVYGYDVKLHARAWALGPDGQRIDVTLTPGMFDGHACLILDPGPVAEAINEWELRGR
ncbi:MAG: hypothetical protein QOF36_2590 [Microbacteriaceae bacterium]|jgi:hypothetical protein|nr:hypothetical protein [Microbacteriaceae bacterium]